MKKNLFQNIALLCIIAFSVIGCDEDFSTVGSGIIGDNNFDVDFEHEDILVYNHRYEASRANELTSYLLGVYNDQPAFGTLKGNIVAQMTPSSYDPVFGNNVVLDSVILNIPYFSTATEINDGNTTYELDSVYNADNQMQLRIYRNNYFLRDFDPNSDFGDALTYFSDGTASDGSTINTAELSGELLFEDLMFKPDNKEIILKEVELDENGNPVLDGSGNPVKNETGRTAPALRVDLTENAPTDFWEDLILNKEGEPELSNPNNFLNHFRGLYFEATEVSTMGSLSTLNLASGNVTLYYRNQLDNNDTDNDGIPNYADVDINDDDIDDNGTDSDDDGINDTYDIDSHPTQIDEDGDGIIDNINVGSASFVLNFTGNIINLLETNYPTLPAGDPTNGDEKLFLKGSSEGNMAIIELFQGENHDEDNDTDNTFEAWRDDYVVLDENNKFQESKRLINEANIVFYIDQNSLMGQNEPDRVFIYDLKNNTPLVDYFIDSSVDLSNGDTRITHLEPLTRVDDDPHGTGIKYKVRITEHLNNLLVRDSSNVKLGLVVTSNVDALENLDIKGFDENDAGNTPKSITFGTFLSPKGTILYGNNFADETKKAKLEIFYTEPNQQ